MNFDETQKKVNDKIDDAQEFMSEKSAKAKASLLEMKADLAEKIQKAKAASKEEGAEIKEDAKVTIKNLEAHASKLDKYIDEFDDNAAETWEEFKDELSSGISQLGNKLEGFIDKFKK